MSPRFFSLVQAGLKEIPPDLQAIMEAGRVEGFRVEGLGLWGLRNLGFGVKEFRGLGVQGLGEAGRHFAGVQACLSEI